MKNYFKGSIPAVITPFTKDLEIDFDALEKHIKFLIKNGVHGLVSCGTTGESPTLTHDEHKLVTEKIMTFCKSKVPVMSGCGSNSTIESIDLVKHSESIGVDAILLVTPYYNKPTQRGIVEHFKLIAKKTNLPIYLYNIPSRSVANIDIGTLKILSKIKNIVGVKDATADLTYPLQTFETCGSNFIQLSGEDATFLSFLVSGGSGCISVSANVIPKLHSQLYNYWYSREYQKAININHKIFDLNRVLFLETSPAPVKYALSLTNGYNPNLRLPLVELEDSTKKKN